MGLRENNIQHVYFVRAIVEIPYPLGPFIAIVDMEVYLRYKLADPFFKHDYFHAQPAFQAEV